MEPDVRSIHLFIEEIRKDGLRRREVPVKKAASACVFRNPFAGQDVEDLSLLYDFSKTLGEELINKAVQSLGIAPEQVESYGKAAIVGEHGELEHCAAVLHPTLGIPIRDGVGGGKAIIPSAKKRGFPGVSIDVPLHYKDAAYVRSHFDAMTVTIPDAPRSDELVLIVAISNAGRPFPRIGGLTKEEVKSEDGLR